MSSAANGTIACIITIIIFHMMPVRKSVTCTWTTFLIVSLFSLFSLFSAHLNFILVRDITPPLGRRWWLRYILHCNNPYREPYINRPGPPWVFCNNCVAFQSYRKRQNPVLRHYGNGFQRQQHQHRQTGWWNQRFFGTPCTLWCARSFPKMKKKPTAAWTARRHCTRSSCCRGWPAKGAPSSAPSTSRPPPCTKCLTTCTCWPRATASTRVRPWTPYRTCARSGCTVRRITMRPITVSFCALAVYVCVIVCCASSFIPFPSSNSAGGHQQGVRQLYQSACQSRHRSELAIGPARRPVGRWWWWWWSAGRTTPLSAGLRQQSQRCRLPGPPEGSGGGRTAGRPGGPAARQDGGPEPAPTVRVCQTVDPDEALQHSAVPGLGR